MNESLHSALVNPAALRAQRAIALTVMVVPFVGTLVAFALALAHGVTTLDLALFFAMYFVSMFGVTAGFHRYFAHRSFRTSRWMQTLLVVLGSMTAQGPLLFWVATHRAHHALSDRPGDPHSPNLNGGGWRGFLYGHLGWMLGPLNASWAHYARDVLKERRLFTLHRLYPHWVLLGLMIPAVIGGVATESAYGALTGFLWGGMVRMFLAHHWSWCVGSVCHLVGRRPFQTRDRSGNVGVVALFAFGEGLQNNHHAFPSSALHALEWWEPDISGWTLLVLARLGLVWDLKVPSAERRRVARGKGWAETELAVGDGAFDGFTKTEASDE